MNAHVQRFDPARADYRLPGRAQHGQCARCGEVLPLIDIIETEGDIVLQAQMPGIAHRDVRVRLDHGILTLQGGQRSGCFFRRLVNVSDRCDAGAIAATFRRGILTVKLPKRAPEQTRTIPITS